MENSRRKVFTLTKLYCLVLCILLFLMMWAPGYWMRVKVGIVLVICLLTIEVNLNRGSYIVKKDCFIWMVIYISSNVFYTILSVVYGNDGALDYLKVDIIEPLIFMIIIFSIDEDMMGLLKKVLIYGSSFLYIYTIVAFLSINDFLPESFVTMMPVIRSNFGGVLPFGLIKPSAEYIAWFYFLIPANFFVFFYKDELKVFKDKKVINVNFILGIVCVVLTLKTALILVAAISLVWGVFLTKYKEQKLSFSSNKFIFGLAIFALCLFVWVYYDLWIVLYDNLIKKVMNSFNTSASYINMYNVVDSGGAIRKDQISDLIVTWKMKPVFGWGVGADSKNIIRSTVHGAYEMTYFAKLMQRGIVGMLLYIIMIAWLYLKTFSIVKKGTSFKIEALYVITGFTGMLIANGTNPYLESFDKLIILFLPLLIINLDYKNKNMA